jgi:L-alanine-DL-glutamate epimerase-like enolase superfamily enzyme
MLEFHRKLTPLQAVPSYHSAVVTQNFLEPVLTAAAVPLDTSIPNVMVQEYTLADEDPKWRILENATRCEGGYPIPPDVPGLGVRLTKTTTHDWLAPPHAQHVHETPLRADGSVLNAV